MILMMFVKLFGDFSPLCGVTDVHVGHPNKDTALHDLYTYTDFDPSY